jgi:hypothetical protein
MDDFWGVVWGASIALIASIVGGLLTAVVGPALSRRAEVAARKEERRTVADDEKRRVLRETIHALDQALRLWVEAVGSGRQKDADARRLDAREALVTLRLWTTEEEAAVADTAVSVLMNRDKWEALLCYSAWSQTAAAWFRGTTPPEAFKEEYKRSVAATRPVVDEVRQRDEAAADKTAT